jgi:hypothetical protein
LLTRHEHKKYTSPTHVDDKWQVWLAT